MNILAWVLCAVAIHAAAHVVTQKDDRTVVCGSLFGAAIATAGMFGAIFTQ